MSFHAPEKYRQREGRMSSDESDGNNGAFIFPPRGDRRINMMAIASDGMGWEHVSVSTPVRCPTWEEMCWVKSLFWDGDDTVVQFHPPESEYVNNHPYCLHLWRPTDCAIPMPPSILVGYKGLTLA